MWYSERNESKLRINLNQGYLILKFKAFELNMPLDVSKVVF